MGTKSGMCDLVDTLFDDRFFRPSRFFQSFGTGFGPGISMDIYEEGGEYIVDAALPGVQPEDADTSLRGNTFTI